MKQNKAKSTLSLRNRGLREIRKINVIPLNKMPDGTCRTLKANYFKTGRINFQYHNDWGTTGAKVIYETE